MIRIPLTPEQFAALTRKAAGKGIVLPGNEGTLSKSGVTAKYIYAEGLLTVTILEKPFFVSTQYCEDELKKYLA